MKKKVDIPDSVDSVRGWVGVWNDGVLGWFGVNHIHPYFREAAPIQKELLRSPIAQGKRAYLCDVTITPRLDSKGRPITRIIKA